MEREYPVGHPAASDYKGEATFLTPSLFTLDYPKGHPSHGGANFEKLSSPDGMREAHNARSTDLQELAMVGSLPPLIDDARGEEIPLTPKQLAHIYAVRKGLRPNLQAKVTAKYKLAPVGLRTSDSPAVELSPEQQGILYIMSHGFTPERAKELLDKYGLPSVIADKEADAHR